MTRNNYLYSDSFRRGRRLRTLRLAILFFVVGLAFEVIAKVGGAPEAPRRHDVAEASSPEHLTPDLPREWIWQLPVYRFEGMVRVHRDVSL